MTTVTINAKITKHQQKQNTSAACSFLFDSGNSYTEYTIRVSIASPPLPFEPINVRRRFSEFRKLYTDLVELGTGPRVMARFPGRSPLKNNLDDEFLNDRKNGLQQFLDAILATPISPERLMNWDDPLCYFLSLTRLFSPPNDDHSERGGSLAIQPNEIRNLEEDFEELRDGFIKLNSVIEDVPSSDSINLPKKPIVPTIEQVRNEAGLRISRVGRGYLGRLLVWRLRLDRSRPMYISLSSIHGFAKGGNAALYYSYSPFVVITCYDGSSGKQLCAARTMTRPATATTDWDWNVDELILLPVVYPDSILVFTVLDQVSLGRHNFLAQASINISRELADFSESKIGAPKPSKNVVSGGGGGGGALPTPPLTVAPPKRGMFNGGRAASTNTPQSPPPPPTSAMNNSRSARVSSNAVKGSDPLSNSSHHKPLKPVNVLELSLGDQKYSVWLEGTTQQASSASPRATGLSVSEHGERQVQAVAPYWSSNPETFTKLRQWDFGTAQASVKWCPLHASKNGILYRLSEPSSFRRQTWLSTYVVLTQDEIILYNNEGDSKIIKRRRIEMISKVAAASATVVASGVATPTELSDPWDAVITIQFEDDENDWQLLSTNGSKGQLSWRKIINEAIFHHASASRYSIGAGVSGSLTQSNVAGFDLGFLPPSRSRLPSADSINGSGNRPSLNNINGGGGGALYASPSMKESAAHYRMASDSPRTSLTNNSNVTGGGLLNNEFSSPNSNDLLVRPRSSSVESPFNMTFAPQPPPPPPQSRRNQTDSISKEPTLRLSVGL